MTPTPGAWFPLVEGEAAARALAAAEAISRDLSSDPAVAPGMSLSSGQSGLALFFDSLEKSLGHAEAGERAEYHLDRAVTKLMKQPPRSASLYGGFAGVAWVTELLAADEAFAEEEDPNADIDEAILSFLRQTSPWRGEFDLIDGLVGWGVYALERLPRPSAAALLELIVTRLAERAEQGADGVSWPHPLNPTPWPDPGMAHGAAGVIAFLARMLQESAASPATASLLAGAVSGVLASSFQREEEEEESDLAWCAGNAGLSAALLAAARACGRDDWARAAHRLATASAERYAGQAPAFDPGLCHGTAGLSHLFHRLYQATGDPALLAAGRRWLERTLEQWQPGEGIGGFRCRGRQANGEIGWIPNPGFLSGSAGIGLALLAATTPVEPAWDRVLLLSGRGETIFP